MEQNVLIHIKDEAEKEQKLVRELVESVYPAFYKQALSRLNYNEDLANDVMLSVFETAQKKAHTVAVHPKPEAWLATVLKHCINRKISKAAKDPTRKITFIDISAIEEIIPDTSIREYEEEYSDTDIDAAKEYVLSQLTQAEMDAYTLRYTEGASIAETAKKLGISEDAVKARLHRIKLKVKNISKNIFSEKP